MFVLDELFLPSLTNTLAYTKIRNSQTKKFYTTGTRRAIVAKYLSPPPAALAANEAAKVSQIHPYFWQIFAKQLSMPHFCVEHVTGILKWHPHLIIKDVLSQRVQVSK